MLERMLRPCGVAINAWWVHAGSSGMLKEPETPQAGDHPRCPVWLLCALETGENPEKPLAG